MQAIRLKKLAELDQISARQALRSYRHLIKYVAGAGRGGKTAIIPIDSLENLNGYAAAVEDFPDEELITPNQNSDPGQRTADFIHSGKSWYATAEKISSYLLSEPTAVLLKARRENWDFIMQPANGSMKKFFNIDVLPFEAQIKFRYELQDEIESKQNAGNANLYQTASLAMRDRADQRLKILQEWQTFRRQAGRGNTSKLDDTFVEAYNLKNPENTISRASLHRWFQSFRLDGLDGLIEKYDRKAHRAAAFDEKAKAYFESLYLDQAKRDAYSCYQNLLAVAKTEGWQVPSFATCRRHLRRISREVVTYLREGKKAFEDTAFPNIIRDPESIAVGEVYVADDRLADISFGDGKAGDRIWTTVWIDMRSRRAMSVVCSPVNDAQAVLDSFYIAAQQHIPQALILDNGSNYREVGAITEENAKLPENLQAPLAKLLGEKNIHWALPGNARTKVVERVFLDMSKMHDKNLPGYTGMNVLNRPEGWYIDRAEGKFLSREQIIKSIQYYFFEIHNNRAGAGKKSPNEIWQEHFLDNHFRRADPEYLRHHLLCVWPKPLQVRTNGIQFGKDAKGRPCYYWDEALQFLCGNVKEVWIKYNRAEPEHIWIYKADGTPLAEVPLHKFSGVPILGGGEKVSQYHAAKRRTVKKIEAYKARLNDIHQLNLTDHKLTLQRADVKKEPEPLVDKMTGEIKEAVDPVDLKTILPAPAKRLAAIGRKRQKLLQQVDDLEIIPARSTMTAEQAWEKLDAILP